MDVGRCAQVLAADDVRDALQRIIVHDGEMIAGRRILARRGLRRRGFVDAPLSSRSDVRSVLAFDENQSREIFA